MKMKSLALAIALVPSFGLSQTVYNYDFNTRFTNGEALNTDGWSSSGSNWTAGSYNGFLYTRNNLGVDSRITRLNDGDFSFSIPVDATRVQLTITARSGNNFWQAGLAGPSGDVIGIGADLVFDNRVFILDGGTRRAELLGSETAFGDDYDTLMLDFDLLAGTADLIRDPGGANTILRNDVPMNATAAGLAAADRLFVRADTAFAGPTSFRIAVVPEPSAVLLGVGGMAFLFTRRRRH